MKQEVEHVAKDPGGSSEHSGGFGTVVVFKVSFFLHVFGTFVDVSVVIHECSCSRLAHKSGSISIPTFESSVTARGFSSMGPPGSASSLQSTNKWTLSSDVSMTMAASSVSDLSVTVALVTMIPGQSYSATTSSGVHAFTCARGPQVCHIQGRRHCTWMDCFYSDDLQP